MCYFAVCLAATGSDTGAFVVVVVVAAAAAAANHRKTRVIPKVSNSVEAAFSDSWQCEFFYHFGGN